MAKFYGAIGFAETVETDPGIWEEKIVERSYSGDVIRNIRKRQASSNSVNDNINVSNSISIVADPYAEQNMYAMRYIVFKGNKWKITDVEVNYPRLTLTIGGIYNGDESGFTS